MAKGYWIARIDVSDMEEYKKYIAANAAPLAEYGGKFLVRGGERQEKEGSHRSRNVVIEFPSYQAARDCYYSDEYQAAIKLRSDVATSDLVIVEGYDP